MRDPQVWGIFKSHLQFLDEPQLEYLDSFLSIVEDRVEFEPALVEMISSHPSIQPSQVSPLAQQVVAQLRQNGIDLPPSSSSLSSPSSTPSSLPPALVLLDKPVVIRDSLPKEVPQYTSPLWEPKLKVERINLDGLDESEIALTFARLSNGEYDIDDDDEEGEDGGCVMCHRVMPLTRHHVIPRAIHGDPKFKRLYTKEEMNTVIMLCRPCHSAIHSFVDEKTMALEFNTLEKLLSLEKVQKWLPFISKQKVRLKPKRVS